jgi:hypothetical protein
MLVFDRFGIVGAERRAGEGCPRQQESGEQGGGKPPPHF